MNNISYPIMSLGNTLQLGGEIIMSDFDNPEIPISMVLVRRTMRLPQNREMVKSLVGFASGIGDAAIDQALSFGIVEAVRP